MNMKNFQHESSKVEKHQVEMSELRMREKKRAFLKRRLKVLEN